MRDMQTLEAPLVSAPETTIMYMAKRSDLRLVKVPVRPIFGTHGQVQGETQGQTLEFRDCVLRVPKEGEVRFSNGTMAPVEEVVSFLERHRLFLDQEEGFWRVDPTAPPVSAEEMKAITRAALAGDEATLTAILEQEREGWGREQIIETAGEALETVTSMKAQIAAEQAQAVAAPETPAPKSAKK